MTLNFYKVLCFPVLGTMLVSCPSEKQELKQFSFSMERTSCFGVCPQYRIYSDTTGAIYYTGILNVSKVGTYVCADGSSMIKNVYRRAVGIKYWELEERYDPGVVDLPSTITQMKSGKNNKTIENVMDAPASLTGLENLIDSLAKGMDWKKIADN